MGRSIIGAKYQFLHFEGLTWELFQDCLDFDSNWSHYNVHNHNIYAKIYVTYVPNLYTYNIIYIYTTYILTYIYMIIIDYMYSIYIYSSISYLYNSMVVTLRRQQFCPPLPIRTRMWRSTCHRGRASREVSWLKSHVSWREDDPSNYNV